MQIIFVVCNVQICSYKKSVICKFVAIIVKSKSKLSPRTTIVAVFSHNSFLSPYCTHVLEVGEDLNQHCSCCSNSNLGPQWWAWWGHQPLLDPFGVP